MSLQGLRFGILQQGGLNQIARRILDSLQVEDDGFVISGLSDFFPSLGELLVRDTVTPANDYFGPITPVDDPDIFTYTAPSPKMVVGPPDNSQHPNLFLDSNCTNNYTHKSGSEAGEPKTRIQRN